MIVAHPNKHRDKRTGSRPSGGRSSKASGSHASRVEGITDDEWAAYLQGHYRRRKRQKVLAAVFAVVGVLVIVNHFLEHMDAINAFSGVLSSSVQDLVVGFPAGGALLLIALMLWGQRDNPPPRSQVAKQMRH